MTVSIITTLRLLEVIASSSCLFNKMKTLFSGQKVCLNCEYGNKINNL